MVIRIRIRNLTRMSRISAKVRGPPVPHQESIAQQHTSPTPLVARRRNCPSASCQLAVNGQTVAENATRPRPVPCVQFHTSDVPERLRYAADLVQRYRQVAGGKGVVWVGEAGCRRSSGSRWQVYWCSRRVASVRGDVAEIVGQRRCRQ